MLAVNDEAKLGILHIQHQPYCAAVRDWFSGVPFSLAQPVDVTVAAVQDKTMSVLIAVLIQVGSFLLDTNAEAL